jgi:predicted Zn-dependent peptidase
LKDDPAEQVEEELLRAAWGSHALARPVIGTSATLAGLTPASLRRHHATMIRPGAVLVAVAGDVTFEELRGFVHRLPLDRPVQPEQLPPVVWEGGHRVICRPGIDQAHVRLAFPALAAGDPATPALAVLNRILGVGSSSRLFQRLREVEGLTYDIWTSLGLRRAGGLLEVGWTCSPGVYDEVWGLVQEELRRIAVDLTDDEVAVTREGMVRGLVMDSELPAARCAMDVAELLDRRRRFDPQRARDEILAVTSEQARLLAAEILRPDRMAAAACGPDGLSVRVA